MPAGCSMQEMADHEMRLSVPSRLRSTLLNKGADLDTGRQISSINEAGNGRKPTGKSSGSPQQASEEELRSFIY